MTSKLQTTLANPDSKEKLQASGVELSNMTPSEFGKLLQEDITRWAKIVKQSGASLD
ncbi:tripartite tricarboxylate transporter substrate-binding protein [Polynucleobacter brandtiae]|uniref:tripartite tricarboxylate transporter substrate-binding protein n=1 Tax=Polynucleobacter brandtiae TaxID=1938816 RepID=UPI0012FD6651|nr:tripartite tricarboxylate transporter substrate-binding protein [Polynucleobacter brandtiae]